MPGKAVSIFEGTGLQATKDRVALGNVGLVALSQRRELGPGLGYQVVRFAWPQMLGPEDFQIRIYVECLPFTLRLR